MNLPQGSRPIVPAMSFSSLKIPAALQAAFKGFDKPTPVQACTWPPALEGRDVVGIAETGRCVISTLYTLAHSLIDLQWENSRFRHSRPRTPFILPLQIETLKVLRPRSHPRPNPRTRRPIPRHPLPPRLHSLLSPPALPRPLRRRRQSPPNQSSPLPRHEDRSGYARTDIGSRERRIVRFEWGGLFGVG